MKKCPYCGEEIQDDAKKCRYCGEWLEEADKPCSQDQKPIESTSKEFPEQTTRCRNKHKIYYIGVVIVIIIVIGIGGFYLFSNNSVKLGANVDALESKGLITNADDGMYNIVNQTAYNEHFDITFLKAKDNHVNRIVYTKNNSNDAFQAFEELTAFFNKQYGTYEEKKQEGMNFLNIHRIWTHGDEATILIKIVTYGSDSFTGMTSDDIMVSVNECYAVDKNNNDW